MIELGTNHALTATLTVLLLTYCRVQACVLALPVFSERLLPGRVRIGVAMVLSPLLAEHSALRGEVGTALQLGGLAAAEVLTGLALGMLVRMFSTALDIAATAIATTASLSQLIGVSNEYSPHPIGGVMHLAGLALIVAMGFPVLVCDLLRESLNFRPLGSWPEVSEIFPLALALMQRGFTLAMLMAAPFILGGFLFQLLSGMISKVMPALPVVFIAAPGAVLLALFGLALLTPSSLSIWATAVLDVMQTELR